MDAGAVVQSGALSVGDGTTNGSTVAIDAGATWTIASGSIARGKAPRSTIDVAGVLTDEAAGISHGRRAYRRRTGSVVAAAGTFDLTGVVGGTGGSLTVDAGATLEATNTIVAGLDVSLAGAGATLALADPAQFGATIDGFTAGETIDLVGIAGARAVLGAGDVLTISKGAKQIASLQLAGDYAGQTFSTASDGKGGTAITVTGEGQGRSARGGGAPSRRARTPSSPRPRAWEARGRRRQRRGPRAERGGPPPRGRAAHPGGLNSRAGRAWGDGSALVIRARPMACSLLTVRARRAAGAGG